jgi:outer membrane lipoprotein SlyB
VSRLWVIGGVAAAVVTSAAAMLAWQSSSAAHAPANEAPVAAVEPAAKLVHGKHVRPEAGQSEHTVASVCHDCGVIESVQTVQHKGEGSGLGAVAGGVLGGVLGHQVGNGNGRTAMTVVGAVGGGLAGNEIEKRAKATTIYQVHIKLDDGKTRTLEQSHAPDLAVGQRVRIDGHQLHALNDRG